MVKGYRSKTDMFAGFNAGELLYSHNQGNQWGKEFVLAGERCIPIEVIEKLPQYFEPIYDETMLIHPEELEKFLTIYKKAKREGLI